MGTEPQQEFKSEKPLTKPQRKTIPFTDISIQTIQESQIQKSLGYEQMQWEFLKNYIKKCIFCKIFF